MLARGEVMVQGATRMERCGSRIPANPTRGEMRAVQRDQTIIGIVFVSVLGGPPTFQTAVVLPHLSGSPLFSER